MGNNYFVVLELPGGKELQFVNGKDSPVDFWKKVETAVNLGDAELVCKRQDTGVSEDVRERAKKTKSFTTFILLNMPFNDCETQTKRSILNKAAQWLRTRTCEILVDSTANFQLVSIDC